MAKDLVTSQPQSIEETNPPSQSLRFKQTQKQITPTGTDLRGNKYPPTYDFRAVPDVKKGMKEAYFAAVSETTGAINEMLGQELIYQAQYASPFGKQLDVTAEAVAASLKEMKPQDAVEGMIVTQMVALHNQMMHYMRKSLEACDYDIDLNLNRFTKLNRHFLNCLHSLLKYRNRGQQKVIVENVNVGPGGRAIVGTVEQGGRG